ncbi:MAG: hypothetical protein LBB82_08610 [Treponema sp.]|jgi:hypothetical protein|nr:hypothetical protein [Treponema sp.]
MAKKIPAGKTPAKKSGTKTAAAKKTPAFEELAKQLKTLIPQLDEEGLAFLVEQARVHLYNMQVTALNEKLALESAGVKGAKSRTKGSGADGFGGIKASDSGASYYVVYKNEWIMFSREEMTALAKIVNGQGTDLEIRGLIYAWLERERRDVLRSIAAADKFDDKIKSFAALVRKTFALRKK